MKVIILLVVLTVVFADFAPLNWTANLDAPLSERYPIDEIISTYGIYLKEALGLINDFVPKEIQPLVEDEAARLVTSGHLGSYGEELIAFSNNSAVQALGFNLGQIALFNMIYEVEAGCTSIIAATPLGRILHGRNLDFNLAPVLRNLTMDVAFVSQGVLQYRCTMYPGFAGCLSGLRPGAFSITLDQRSEGYLIQNFLEALLVPGTYINALLIRDVLAGTYGSTFSPALRALSTQPTAAPAYIIIAGTQEGAVVTRDRNEAVNVWRLAPPFSDRWFEVETNYDHWLPDPTNDPRATVANKAMAALGRAAVSLPALYSVLSIEPVLNGGTTYTVLMCPETGEYETTVRTNQATSSSST